MTLWEIQKTIEGKQAGLKAELETNMRMSAVVAYNQANLLARLIGQMFTKGPKKFPSPGEAFPGIFPDEVTRPKQQDWRIMKARMEQYAAAKKRWEVNKRGNDDRGTASTNHSQNERITKRNEQSKNSNAVCSKGNG